VGEIHFQLAQLDPLLAVLERLALEPLIAVVQVEVLFFGFADDLARDVARALELHEHRVLEEHGAVRFAMFGLNDHGIAEGEPERAGIEEELPARAAQGDLNDVRHLDLYGAVARSERGLLPGDARTLLVPGPRCCRRGGPAMKSPSVTSK